MAEVEFGAFHLGQGLGLASSAFSRGDTQGAGAILGQAWLPSQPLYTLHLIHSPLDGVRNEAQCIALREAIGGELDRSNGAVHDIYQAALHLGIALGQTRCSLADWRGGAGHIFTTGIRQALADMASPRVVGLFGVYANQVEALVDPSLPVNGPAAGAELDKIMAGMIVTMKNAAPPR